MAQAAPPPRRGVTKNLLVVALCLLVGGAVASVLREPSVPRTLPREAVDAGVLTGGPAVPTQGPKVPKEEPKVPIREVRTARLDGPFVDPRVPRRMPPGRTARPKNAAVWCEGLSVERCGSHREDCEVGAYCDGVRFCRSRPEFPSAEACAAEGILGANVACCSGLVARCGVPAGGRGACNPQKGDESEPVCIRCGDGVCGPFEQACNCPEDCATSEARPKLRFQGPWPQGVAPDGAAPEGTTAPGQCLDTQASPEGVLRCLESWSEGLFGLRRSAELQRVEDLESFTPFDLDLMRCLERGSSYAARRSETSREGCLEALYQRTQDSRLDKLRWFSSSYGRSR
ncbi:hypothetical protein MYSTI_07774 [Myxococcus stipitatus DSM 14675]|uniref:Uncharacterized protein n=1 Tax=Myxococcus stipitatus (strain DSM 14675 / JCM 12634 / Mx s8) TaxID=1278073 RepID=L7UJ88_MYXSD|nr:hypothetical protein [Myxococcus stipitatus]AGC49046.1 hypothetical protein MYSTI_07774 [Myxococcus stipitatus DSM 14675]